MVLNRQRALENGFMHALFHPAFNALATALATSRHKQSQLLDYARDRRVDQAGQHHRIADQLQTLFAAQFIRRIAQRLINPTVTRIVQ